MVEFVRKTIAVKDCTLDATYSDMYDGTNPYLKVGGIVEPKKALLRFQVAAKPTFGDAELSSGEVGLYSTGLKLGTSATFPTFNLYKIKTSPDGRDWGGDGRLRPITRGKQIIGVDKSDSGTYEASVNVISHELSTGDTVWWSPVDEVYGDCTIAPLIAEVEYYAIRIDRDNFSFAASIKDAIADIRINISEDNGNNSGGYFGYVRSEKYNMDIHVVCATPSIEREVVSENFNGSAYRETDLEFVYIQRNVTRRGEPYLANGDALVDNPIENAEQGNEAKGKKWYKTLWIGAIGDEKTDNLEKWYGNGEDGGDFKIWLTSHKTNSDGSGWWRTVEDAGKWGGGHDYVAKKNPAVHFDDEILAEAEPYGDEVTPENCFFHVVKGAAEFQLASTSEEGENDLQGTGAIRLSNKKVLTGGQSCNIYQFWKLDGIGVTYGADNGSGEKDRQECMMAYKGLPLPNKNWTLIDKGTHGHGLLPHDNATSVEISHGSGDMCVSMTVNFEKLEMAHSRLGRSSASATTSDITLRRGFHVIFAAVPPRSSDSLYGYIRRLAGNISDGERLDTDNTDEISACGYSIVNTSAGMVLYPLDLMRIDSRAGYEDIYMKNVGHTSGTGTDTPQTCVTHMEEGEWYTIKTFFPEALNQQAALIVEDSAGEPRQYKASNESEGDFWENNPIPLSNIKTTSAGTHSNRVRKPWFNSTAAHDWYQHMSIWVTNVESAHTTGTVVGGNNHPGEDWMASEDDRDTSHNIFIDRIGVTGVNLDHENATVGQEGRSRSKIYIAGNKSYDTVMDGADAGHGAYWTDTLTLTGGEYKFSSDNRSRRADNLICLGFEDPSQILSSYKVEKSWRYLFWHGYKSANIGADNKIGWTADDSLPATDYATTGTLESKRWFSDMPDNATRSTGFSANVSGEVPQHMEILDAGAPYTFSIDYGGLKEAVIAFYSDNHVSLGAQLSDESLDMRELWRNHTKDDNDAHRKGAKQSMYKSVPSLGALFNVSSFSSGIITISAGPNNGSGVYWNSGQKLIYYNADYSSVAYSAPEAGNLDSGNGKFNDTPTVYYWERSADTLGALHLSYAQAITGNPATRLILTAQASQTHHLYDYDYYMNRKYWIDGWSSKGLSRLILEPVDNAETPATSLNRYHLASADIPPAISLLTGPPVDSSDPVRALTTVSIASLKLTKREHVGCAAKILEIDGANVNVATPATSNSSSGYVCRVDSTEMLRSTVGTTYRIWFAASALHNDNYATGLSINIIDEEHIAIQGWNGKSIGGDIMTETHTASATGELGGTNLSSSLCRLWIGPEKYWVSFLIRNQSGDTEATFGDLPLKTYSAVSVCAPFGSAGDENAEEHRDSAGMYDAWGVPGATYNEFLYNPDKVSGVRGAYVNQWNPSPNLDPNLTIYDLEDFGYGAAKEDKDGRGGENGVIGGYVGKFIPRESQVNRIKMPNVFSAGEPKVEGDYLDLAIQQETLSSDAIMTVASTDNGAYPTPFLLTVFEDSVPEAPVDFDVEPNEKNAFLPEFTWTSSDADLWYGFITIDDTPINNQYHRSILHVPLDEDLSSVVSSYDDESGWYYSITPNPAIYGYRYSNTNIVPSGIHKDDALASAGTDKILATSATLYDNVEGLAGNTKYFDILNEDSVSIGSHVQFPFSATSTSSGFSYPIDEMSILVHITPESWGTDRYIAAFSNPDGSEASSWSLYLDDKGHINATVGAAASTTHPDILITLKSTTKVPVDGTPTCIILTVDTQIHSGNVKLFINGRLEDQSGLRGALSINNWPTDADGQGGDDIFYDTDGTEDLIIGAKSVIAGTGDPATYDRKSFIGKIEEFVWYDIVIYPVIPQNGLFVLDKPLEELADGAASASSKSYTARLFIKDYHNIRGKTSGEVAASSQISFKKAAFELNTTVVA